MSVEVVFTERRATLTEERARNYARLRERLAAASGQAIEAMHYEEVDAERLGRASSIVLSGSTTVWPERDPAELERLGDAVRTARCPVLGICAGMQLQALFAGGRIELGRRRASTDFSRSRSTTGATCCGTSRQRPWSSRITPTRSPRFPRDSGCSRRAPCARSRRSPIPARRWWGTQFHPEESRPEHPAASRSCARSSRSPRKVAG